MQEQRIYLLISLQLSNEASPEELQELEGWLSQHPEWQLKREILLGLWKTREAGSATGIASSVGTAFDPATSIAPAGAAFDPATSAAYNRHLQRLSNAYPGVDIPAYGQPVGEISMPVKKRMRPFLAWTAGIAALLCLLAAGGWWINRWQKDASVLTTPNAISTKRGSKSRIELPDGTAVWLNADSRITYNAGNFTGCREIKLDGEAYFDVASDPLHPFVIHAHSVDIRVLGTAFDVRSYGDERTTQTSLFKGSVQVTLPGNAGQRIILRPNEKLVVLNTGGAIPRPDSISRVVPRTGTDVAPLLAVGKVHFDGLDSTSMEAMWTKNKLAFDHETLEDIALDIERWYDIRVTIAGDRLRHTLFTATFDDEPLDSVLHALNLAGGDFTYTIRKKEVIIKPNR